MIAAIIAERRGFTLIELMIVVLIISILASISIPVFHDFTCRARQSEARSSLALLAKCQEAYFIEHETYSLDKQQIGFKMTGTPRYTYEIVSADAVDFTATAKATYDDREDKWEIDSGYVLKNEPNACKR